MKKNPYKKCKRCEWAVKLPSGNVYCKMGQCFKESIKPKGGRNA